jgi:DNA-binding NarL/FixJ family response regulator
MALVVQGRTSKQIARELLISELTVRKHRENLLRKLGLRSAARLVALVPARPEGDGARPAGAYDIGSMDGPVV